MRNVLVGEGNLVKLGDFGLAQYLNEGGQVKTCALTCLMSDRRRGFVQDGPRRCTARAIHGAGGIQEQAVQHQDRRVGFWRCAVGNYGVCFHCAGWNGLSVMDCSYGETPYSFQGVEVNDVKAFVTAGKRLNPPSV